MYPPKFFFIRNSQKNDIIKNKNVRHQFIDVIKMRKKSWTSILNHPINFLSPLSDKFFYYYPIQIFKKNKNCEGHFVYF